MPNCFLYRDYKDYLKAVIESQPRGFISRLAEAAPCQRSYLSKVISADIHITTDQAFNLSHFLQHSDSERDFFFSLVEFARASSKTYREHLNKKIEKLKRDNEDLSIKLNRNVMSFSEKEAFYYSSYLPGLLHILTSIPEFQKAEAMCSQLGIPRDLVENILQKLFEFDFISKQKDRYIFKGGSLHVSKTSPYVIFHHQNWRQQAVIHAQRNSHSEVVKGIHYTNVQSMSRKAFEQIKQQVIELIEKAAAVSGPSKEEVLVGFLTDIFLITD